MASKDNKNGQTFAADTAATTPATNVDPFVQQLPIRLVKNPDVKSNVMRFNAKDFVPIEQWHNLKMWRERAEELSATPANENTSSFRPRKRVHQDGKKQEVEQKPWILNVNGKKGKQYRGTRSGGIDQHATYYVFNTAPDGAIEAQRLDEFYTFQPISRFTPLTAEEAEEEYKRRKRVLNLFSIMTRKRLLGDERAEEEAAAAAAANVGGSTKVTSADFKITDNDEWMDSSDCDSDDVHVKGADKKADDDADVDEDGRRADKKKKQKKAKLEGKGQKKSKPEDFILEKDAFEESDDGDNDGREMDYESDSSDGEPDVESKCAMKSVAEEDALRKLLTSDGEEDDEGSKPDKDEENENETVKDTNKQNKNGSDNEDKTEEPVKAILPSAMPPKKTSFSKNRKLAKENAKKARSLDSLEVLTSATKRSNKSIVDATASDAINEKQIKDVLERPSTSAAAAAGLENANAENSYLEEITKRYLSRKPISAVELLHKMKSKYSHLPNEKLLEKVTQVLKKINPVKSVSKGKMFFSLKKDN